MSLEPLAEANEVIPAPNASDDLIETPEEQAERIARHRNGRKRSDRPIPSVQCSYVRRDGSRCRGWALRGSTVCIAHGARLPSVRAAAARRVEEARIKLGMSAPHAVDVIIEQMVDPDTPAYVRQKAAFGLIDRAGIAPGHKTEVTGKVEVEHHHTASNAILATLDRYTAALPTSEIESATDVIDAELVEDEPEA